MKRIVLLLLLPGFLIACSAHKTSLSASPEIVIPSKAIKAAEHKAASFEKTEAASEEETDFKYDIIETAKDFLGTAYEYGGTSRAGMDCSGLVYAVFLLRDVALPRASYAMAEMGEELPLSSATPGDLLFFKTGRKKNVISHVGIIVELNRDKIYFIHSTTSRGVIISSLDENYWQQHFVMARRIQ
ncbi:MAG: C40 family peptidase [Salinimicrobium sp.]